jgi:hypothetical protein
MVIQLKEVPETETQRQIQDSTDRAPSDRYCHCQYTLENVCAVNIP